MPPRRRLLLGLGSFLLPLAVWCAISYVPFLWHPLVEITRQGDAAYLKVGDLVTRQAFATENARIRQAGGEPAEGFRRNPIYLPPPHEVARAFATAFTTEPRRRGEPWLHESLALSIRVIAYAFGLASLFGVPLGILPDLHRDMRILLGWAWTYLIVAEVVGTSTGITWFINQQAKYRIYENVFAAIAMIGIIGLLTDLALGWLGNRLFPWHNQRPSRLHTLLALAHWGHHLTKRDLTCNINFFMNVPVTPDGKLTFEDGISHPGKYIEMRADMNVICLISNGPQLNIPCNAYNPTPVRLLIWD